VSNVAWNGNAAISAALAKSSLEGAAADADEGPVIKASVSAAVSRRDRDKTDS
jgi:hypothetical protein